MMLLMLFFVLALYAALSVIAGITPAPTALSRFELERRSRNGESAAMSAMRRENLLVDVISLQRIIIALLLIVLTAVSIGWFGWISGILLSCLLALTFGAVARVRAVNRLSQRAYQRYEHAVLHFVEKFSTTFRWLRYPAIVRQKDARLESREELQHLIADSQGIISADERSLMTHGLQFAKRVVKEIMTPRTVIDSVNKKDMLGPLVLDDLHKTGHSRFPVIDQDVDHIVGMLYVQDLLSLDIKRSVTAEKAMDPHVYYIHEQQTLQHALTAFLRTRHHLFVVVNDFEETVGLLSLEDTIEALIGQKIVDEFDTHSDLRVVAMRNPRGNNQPKKRDDV